MNGHCVHAREALQEVLSADDAGRVTSKAALSNIPKPLNPGRSYLNMRFPRTTGSGIQRMTAACQEAGLDVPRLEEIGVHFRVTIFRARISQPRADDTDRRILALFADGAPRSTADVAKHVGLSQRATLTRLKAMTGRGLLVEIGTGPHDPKRQYVLA